MHSPDQAAFIFAADEPRKPVCPPEPDPVGATLETMAALDWQALGRALDETGVAVIPRLLNTAQCTSIASSYREEAGFRSRIVMARHNFGRGEYKYFAYPLPPLVQALRATLYAYLVPIANRWNALQGAEIRYPKTHAGFIRQCHEAGQCRPTPLLLQYGEEDYNCLHQDVYGERVFPLQVAVLLSQPGHDFEGGEFVLTEQRPRMQSRVEVVPLNQGDAAIFAVHHRPVQGVRSAYKANMRHGVSRIRSGHRHTLGIIFHDAL